MAAGGTLLFAAIIARASCETFTVAPVRSKEYCTRGYSICSYTLSCEADYTLECQSIACEAEEKVCTDLGDNFRPSEWNGHCEDWPDDVDTRYECCQCVGSQPAPEIITPTSSGKMCRRSASYCPTSLNSNCCKDELSCPDGYELSSTLPLCGATSCDRLGSAYAASEIIYMSEPCTGIFPKDQALCKTCEKMASGGTSSSQEPLASTSAPTTGAGWEFVGSAGKAACRGRNIDDNSPSYYEVHEGITELLVCQAKCEQHPSCKGVEYSHGRCEIWMRPQGIFAWAELNSGSFTCMRFGWPTNNLLPVDGGEGRACRGDHSAHNSDAFYVVEVANSLEECKAACSAAPVCHGIEFSLGRCEIWRRRISASAALANFTCLAYQGSPAALTLGQPIVLP